MNAVFLNGARSLRHNYTSYQTHTSVFSFEPTDPVSTDFTTHYFTTATSPLPMISPVQLLAPHLHSHLYNGKNFSAVPGGVSVLLFVRKI